MDYEKAYKDALERAKEIHDSPNASSRRKEWLESIFPELAESEDERIRKELRDLLVNCCEADRKFPHLLAWLEKQKEQKPAEWSEEDETMLDALIRKFEGEDIYVSPHLAEEWLKSLRPQPHWKPSEEQPRKSYCEENCKGYRDTGGRCFFGFNCSAKKAQEQPDGLDYAAEKPKVRLTSKKGIPAVMK